MNETGKKKGGGKNEKKKEKERSSPRILHHLFRHKTQKQRYPYPNRHDAAYILTYMHTYGFGFVFTTYILTYFLCNTLSFICVYLG